MWSFPGRTHWLGNEDSEPVKTASGTFYPLPMVTVAEMDKLLAPSGTSVASFDRILAPGGTAVESEHHLPTGRTAPVGTSVDLAVVISARLIERQQVLRQSNTCKIGDTHYEGRREPLLFLYPNISFIRFYYRLAIS